MSNDSMKRMLSIAAAAALFLLSSCQEVEPEIFVDVPEVTNPAAEVTAVTFTALTEDHSTKTALSRNGDMWDVVWKSGDNIVVNGYRLSLEETDQAEGYGPECTKALFSGYVLGNSTSPKYRAWYPEALGKVAGNLSLPSVQDYAPDGVYGFPMYAESDSESLQFKNICGIVRLNLKGTKNISAIGLLDKSDSPSGLSGSIDIDGSNASVKSGAAGVTLKCAAPVALSSDDFTTFLITVPAGSYDRLQITVTSDDESYAILTSKKAIIVERSKITDINISTLKFKNDKADIRYSTTNTTQISKYPVGADGAVFGDGLTVVGHSYDPSSKEGVITLSGPVSRIGDNAFSSLNNLETITIPESVTSIGSQSFYDCRNLTTINWPEALTSVGYRAFCLDAKLATIDLSHIVTIGQEAFNNTNLNIGLVIDGNITAIGTDAFRNTKVTSVTFNDFPATVSTGMFLGCKSLTAVTFNCDVPALPGNTFQDCNALTSVTFKGSLGAIGDREFYNCKALTDGISLDGTGVTSIGSEAFYYVPLNSGFDIPSTVLSIGGAAFNNCTGLVSITVPDCALTGNHTFNECRNLESVTFTGGTRMTSIPYRSFYGCSKLTSVNCIPSCVTSLDNEAFMNCGLTSLPDGWGRDGIKYGNSVFAGCPVTHITFPDNWTSIPNHFCYKMSQLSSVDFGNGLTALGWQVFAGCSSLTSVTIPSNVRTLTNYCFYQSGVTSVTGMNRSDLIVENNAFAESKLQTADISNWTNVPGGCFINCSDLETVILGEGLTTIRANAFQNCTSLTSISLPSTLTVMENYAFSGTGLSALPDGMHDMTFGSSIFKDTPITSVTFPAGLTKTGDYMFSGCSLLTSADLVDVETLAEGTFSGCSSLVDVDFSSVETLKKYAFINCTALVCAVLPNTLTRMYEHIFDGCSSLETVDIGTGLRTMDACCFQYDNNLATLIIRASSVPELKNTLNSSSKAKIPLIYVPDSLVEDYKLSPVWSNYSSYFRPLSDYGRIPPPESSADYSDVRND